MFSKYNYDYILYRSKPNFFFLFCNFKKNIIVTVIKDNSIYYFRKNHQFFLLLNYFEPFTLTLRIIKSCLISMGFQIFLWRTDLLAETVYGGNGNIILAETGIIRPADWWVLGASDRRLAGNGHREICHRRPRSPRSSLDESTVRTDPTRWSRFTTPGCSTPEMCAGAFPLYVKFSRPDRNFRIIQYPHNC